jgi:acyl-CoA thioester hydrolase
MSDGERPARSSRGDYVRFVPISTRWMDNDVYGHVNNVVYYSFFDTAVNQILVETGVLDPATSETIGLVVETRCNYFASIAFPARIEVGLRVTKIGRSSVRYAVAIFSEGEDLASAQGSFTHVYVARATQKPVSIPERVLAVLRSLQAASADA